MKKNNAGITLVSLVITIIVLIILASISVYSGISTVRSAKLTKFTTELKIMQQKVNELYDSYMNNRTVNVNGIEYVGKGQAATETEEAKQGVQEIGKVPESIFYTNRLDEIFSEEASGITDKTGYRYYDIETIQALGLEDMEYEFFVNVETRSVVSIEGFNDYGKTYYTLDQVPNGMYNVDYNKIDGNLDFEATSEIKNDQKKIHVSDIRYDQYVNKWQVRYRLKAEEGEEENSWKVTQEFTGSEILIDVDELGIYEVQVFHGQEIVKEIKEVEVAPRPGLKIGDYVNYIADTVEEAYSLPTNETGFYNKQTLNQENKVKWRILNIYSDGTLDLISANAIRVSTADYIYFAKSLGYNNAVYFLNDICETFYSNKKLNTKARSINIEDIEKHMNEQGTIEKNKYVSSGGVQYGYQKKYESGTYPDLYAQENGSGVNSEEIKKDGIGVSDVGANVPTTKSDSESENGLIATQTYYGGIESYIENQEIQDMLFNEKMHEYWIASRFVNCLSSKANFGLYAVEKGKVMAYDLVGGATSYAFALIRPVVTISPEIKIEPCANEANGLDEEHMHSIIE